MNTQNSLQKIQQLEEDNRRLHRGIEELAILNEIAIAINSTFSITHIIELIIHKCVKHFHTEQAALLLLDKEDRIHPLHTMIR
jgi:hypothetical protein